MQAIPAPIGPALGGLDEIAFVSESYHGVILGRFPSELA
jgi:hypothetical protein